MMAPGYPSYAETQARHLAEHRARALGFVRALAAAAAACEGRAVVFGSLATGCFHRASDVDVALDAPAARLDDLVLEAWRLAALHDVTADILRLGEATPRVARRIREEGLDAAGLE